MTCHGSWIVCAKIDIWIIDSGSLLCALMVLTTPLTLPLKLVESSKCPCWKVRASIGSTRMACASKQWFLVNGNVDQTLKTYQISFKRLDVDWKVWAVQPLQSHSQMKPELQKMSKCWSVFWCAFANENKSTWQKMCWWTSASWWAWMALNSGM